MKADPNSTTIKSAVDAQPMGRRRVLRAMVLTPAAVGSFAASATANPTRSPAAASNNTLGYTLTPHVREYYRLAGY